MIWKTSHAHPPKSNDCYRENSYLPVVLYHHWHEETRDSPAADSEHTDHLSGKRKPEGSRQIRNESCAKHVSIELLFQTSGPAVLWMYFITWFYWTLLLLAYCFPHITYSSSHPFLPHILQAGRLSRSASLVQPLTPLTPVGTRVGICPQLRYEHPAHPAVLSPSWPKGWLVQAFWCRFHSCQLWHWKIQFMQSPDKSPHRLFFHIRHMCRKVK